MKQELVEKLETVVFQQVKASAPTRQYCPKSANYSQTLPFKLLKLRKSCYRHLGAKLAFRKQTMPKE